MGCFFCKSDIQTYFGEKLLLSTWNRILGIVKKNCIHDIDLLMNVIYVVDIVLVLWKYVIDLWNNYVFNLKNAHGNSKLKNSFRSRTVTNKPFTSAMEIRSARERERKQRVVSLGLVVVSPLRLNPSLYRQGAGGAPHLPRASGQGEACPPPSEGNPL